MRRFRQWKRLSVVLVAALLSTAVASALLPGHRVLGVQAALTAPAHHHEGSCCPADSASCDVACVASGACDFNLPLIRTDAPARELGSTVANSELAIVVSSASVLLDSPPPRA